MGVSLHFLGGYITPSHPSSDDMSVATGDDNDLCLPGLRTVLEIKSCSCSIITLLRMT